MPLERVASSLARYASFAFPSGHTAATSATMGLICFLLILALLDKYAPSWAAQADQQREEGKEEEASSTPSTTLPTLLSVLWTIAVVETAVSRVLADVHWTTDTVGDRLGPRRRECNG